jgi:charged multivesicular body protein 1
MDAQLQARLQARQLESEARRLQKESNRAREQARRDFQAGNNEAARLHAQEAVRAAQGATQLLQQSSAVSGLALDIQSAQMTAEVAESLARATQAMEDANHEIDLDGLAADTAKFDNMRSAMKQTPRSNKSCRSLPSYPARTRATPKSSASRVLNSKC